MTTLKFQKYTVIVSHGDTDYIYLSTDSLFRAKEEMDDVDQDWKDEMDACTKIIEDYGTLSPRLQRLTLNDQLPFNDSNT